jgi:hypothetical protein
MAGSLPSAEELEQLRLLKLGIVQPRIVTSAPTPKAKLEKMQADIEASKIGKIISRNKRVIAKEHAAMRKASSTPEPDEKSWREWNLELRDFISAAKDWWPLLPQASQDEALHLYWAKLVKGMITPQAWHLEMKNLKVSVLGLPRSVAEQQQASIDEQKRWARNAPMTRLPGGW